jgi:hypothetical protein
MLNRLVLLFDEHQNFDNFPQCFVGRGNIKSLLCYSHNATINTNKYSKVLK